MMRRPVLATMLAIGLTASALAQTQPGPHPRFAPRVDRPTCTRDEFKAATGAYVEPNAAATSRPCPFLPTRSSSRT